MQCNEIEAPHQRTAWTEAGDLAARSIAEQYLASDTLDSRETAMILW